MNHSFYLVDILKCGCTKDRIAYMAIPTNYKVREKSKSKRTKSNDTVLNRATNNAIKVQNKSINWPVLKMQCQFSRLVLLFSEAFIKDCENENSHRSVA